MSAVRKIAPKRPIGPGPRICQVPALCLDDPDLTPADIRTLLALGRFTDASGYCWPGQKELAEMFGEVTRQAISKRLLRLRRLGWVEVVERRTPRGSQITNGYRVRFDLTMDELDAIMDRRARGLDEAGGGAAMVASADDSGGGGCQLSVDAGGVDNSVNLSTESCGGATSIEVAGAQPHGSCAIERPIERPIERLIERGARARAEIRDGEGARAPDGGAELSDAERAACVDWLGEGATGSWIDDLRLLGAGGGRRLWAPTRFHAEALATRVDLRRALASALGLRWPDSIEVLAPGEGGGVAPVARLIAPRTAAPPG